MHSRCINSDFLFTASLHEMHAQVKGPRCYSWCLEIRSRQSLLLNQHVLVNINVEPCGVLPFIQLLTVVDVCETCNLLR